MEHGYQKTSRRLLWTSVRQEARSMVEDITVSPLSTYDEQGSGENKSDGSTTERVGDINGTACVLEKMLREASPDASDETKRITAAAPAARFGARNGIDTKGHVIKGVNHCAVPPSSMAVDAATEKPMFASITSIDVSQALHSEGWSLPAVGSMVRSSLEGNVAGALEFSNGCFENTGADLHRELAEEKQKNIAAQHRLLSLDREVKALRQENKRLCVSVENIESKNGQHPTPERIGTPQISLDTSPSHAFLNLEEELAAAKQYQSELENKIHENLITIQRQQHELEEKENRIRQLEGIIADGLLSRANDGHQEVHTGGERERDGRDPLRGDCCKSEEAPSREAREKTKLNSGSTQKYPVMSATQQSTFPSSLNTNNVGTCGTPLLREAEHTAQPSHEEMSSLLAVNPKTSTSQRGATSAAPSRTYIISQGEKICITKEQKPLAVYRRQGSHLQNRDNSPVVRKSVSPTRLYASPLCNRPYTRSSSLPSMLSSSTGSIKGRASCRRLFSASPSLTALSMSRHSSVTRDPRERTSVTVQRPPRLRHVSQSSPRRPVGLSTRSKKESHGSCRIAPRKLLSGMIHPQ
uniref:Uncharacterized protein n=1 Tax=Trypanosoma congolense (strain IL3000) TaxID=1068625 RepID=G0UMX0_TRYCI|nr:conserved hypothetical protein [Trypanosoma congolense IL3000]